MKMIEVFIKKQHLYINFSEDFDIIKDEAQPNNQSAKIKYFFTFSFAPSPHDSTKTFIQINVFDAIKTFTKIKLTEPRGFA